MKIKQQVNNIHRFCVSRKLGQGGHPQGDMDMVAAC